jgi:hypothetical protein
MTQIRDYRDTDAAAWLRCRLLSFFGGLGKPVTAFMHAPIALEAAMRERFSRVHVCRQYVRSL